MQRLKVELSQKAFEDQKSDLIIKLDKQRNELQGDIKTLEKDKKNIKVFVDEKLKERIKSLDVKENNLNQAKENSDNVLRENLSEQSNLAKDRKDFADHIGKERDSLSQTKKVVDNQAEENKRVTEELTKKSSNVKKQEIQATKSLGEVKAERRLLKTEKEELANLVKEAEKLNVDIKISRNALSSEKATIDTAVGILKKKENKLLEYSSVIEKKEIELIKESKEIEKKKEGFAKIEDEIARKKEDVIVLGKKNQTEVTRLKSQAVDLNNREAKLNEREKLFKVNIGG